MAQSDQVNGNPCMSKRDKLNKYSDNEIDFLIEDVETNGDVFEGSASVHNRFAFVSMPMALRKEFTIDYFGEKVLNRRHTQPMLPWIMADVKRHGSKQRVILEIHSRTLRAMTYESRRSAVFEHKLQTLCRFARSHQDPKCFAYQIRINMELPFTCHFFMADNETLVPQLVAMIRDATRESLKDCNDSPDLSADLFTGSHVMMTRLFEVLYLGKVVVSSKKTPPTFIDDVVSQFKDTTSFSKCRNRHASGVSVRSLPASLEDHMDEDEEPDIFSGHSLTVASATRRRKSVGGIEVEREDRTNRTRLIHVGETDLCLISPDRKSVILRRKFKDISFCSQGIKHRDHFGFISRDVTSNNFFCYVFMCANDSVVGEVMQTLKQAFQVAFQHNSKKHVVCELCPMHQFHNLCLAVDKCPAQETNEVIQKRISQLKEGEKQEIANKLSSSQAASLEDMNTVLMAALHSMCEHRQGEHVHIGEDGGPVSKNELNLMECAKNKSSKFDSLKIRAKKSFTASFENLIRGRNRKEETREASKKLTIDSSNSNSTETTPHTTPDNTPLTSPTQLVPFNLPSLILTVTPPDEEPTSPPGRPRSNSDPSVVLTCKSGASIPNTSLIETHSQEKCSPVTTRRARLLIRSPSSPVNFTCDHQVAPPPPHKSWRLQMLSRVVSPKGKTSHKCILASPYKSVHSPLREGRKLSRQRVHELWKKAILETLLMTRMQRNTQKAVKDIKGQKLHYTELTPCLRAATNVWDELLATPDRSSLLHGTGVLQSAIVEGVPRSLRGDIWRMLVEQHRLGRLAHDAELKVDEDAPPPSYRDLLKQLTSYQHAILIDLGRTFPHHPYFSSQLGAGQLSLFNLLKAYSLRDPQVGYCQGLSFIAGVLLMHMDEEDAFDTLTYLMFQLGLRRQFCPDMVVLQIQLYQLSRLLHDNHRDLCCHLEAHDVSATLYSAAWFLTLFASQFPLGFVSRVFDLIFLQGTDVVFKVALVLLGNHRDSIMQCDSMESVVSLLKTTLPKMSGPQMEAIIKQVIHMDISRQLHAYEVEYHVLQEEMMSPIDDHCCPQMEALQQQNATLAEQLVAASSNQKALEAELAEMRASANRLKFKVQSLEQERSVLLATLTHFNGDLDGSGLVDGRLTGCGDT